LQHDLILVVALHSIGVLAVSPIFGSARRLHVRGPPWFRTQRAQKRRGVRRAGADFHVVRLQERTALPVPIVLELENDLLERLHRFVTLAARAKALILRD